LRTFDAGILVLGDPVTSFPDIPPNDNNVRFQTNCPTECTERFTHDITVFCKFFLHMHNIGKQMVTTLHRGDESNVTNRVDFYQFNFQQITETNFVIKPGDRLNTHCVYDSTERTEPTIFGPGSDDEMCMDFLMYFPLLVSQNTNQTFIRCGAVYHEGRQLTLCGSRNEYIDIDNPTIAESLSILDVQFGKPCGDDTPTFWLKKWMIIAGASILTFLVILVIIIAVLTMKKKSDDEYSLIR